MVLYWRRYGRAGGCQISKRKIPERVLNRTDTFQRAERKAKPAKTKVLPLSSRELLLYNWFLPVIRGLKGRIRTLSVLMTDKYAVKDVP